MFTGFISDELTEYCEDPLNAKFDVAPNELNVGEFVFVRSFTLGNTAFFHNVPEPGYDLEFATSTIQCKFSLGIFGLK
jgi:hypothetical protein